MALEVKDKVAGWPEKLRTKDMLLEHGNGQNPISRKADPNNYGHFICNIRDSA